MKIQNVQITGVGGIENLKFSLNPSMNLICGPNGIGKTTIIECIAHAFGAGQTSILKLNAKSEKGFIAIEYSDNGQHLKSGLSINKFEPNENEEISGTHHLSKYILSLKTTRIFTYQSLQAVSRDTNKPAYMTLTEAINGIGFQDIKNWFVNRFLYSVHPGVLKSSHLHNFEISKKCFSMLDENFKFAKVDPSSNEIILSTPSGNIYYEYLSSGFKSCISTLFAIIKEIEFRFPESEIRIDEFDGIILIDELDLHLHPEWQSRIATILCKVFPKAQFITTTHSPHMIQAAKPNQIIALEKNSSKTCLHEIPDSKYGFMGWTIEEVLVDVMGMKETMTNVFNMTLSDFDKAIENENHDKAILIYSELDKLLHPQNSLRKLLRFQLASINEATND